MCYGQECAAYDFQYVGGGYGVKDIVYLFCSGLEVRNGFLDSCRHAVCILGVMRKQQGSKRSHISLAWLAPLDLAHAWHH